MKKETVNAEVSVKGNVSSRVHRPEEVMECSYHTSEKGFFMIL